MLLVKYDTNQSTVLTLSYTTQEITSKTYLTKEKKISLLISGCQRNNKN